MKAYLIPVKMEAEREDYIEVRIVPDTPEEDLLLRHLNYSTVTFELVGKQQLSGRLNMKRG